MACYWQSVSALGVLYVSMPMIMMKEQAWLWSNSKSTMIGNACLTTIDQLADVLAHV